jgi:hypothetical protein
VESIDPVVLMHLRKGHTREDFVEAVTLCRAAGVRLAPTFVPFTPWTDAARYVELLDQLAGLGLEEDVAPIQLGIRLLVTADSALLEVDDIRDGVAAFDPASLTWPWRHRDPTVDRLQVEVMQMVGSMRDAPRLDVFDAIDALAREVAGAGIRLKPDSTTDVARRRSPASRSRLAAAPHLTEAWYCCAEPGPDIANCV